MDSTNVIQPGQTFHSDYVVVKGTEGEVIDECIICPRCKFLSFPVNRAYSIYICPHCHAILTANKKIGVS